MTADVAGTGAKATQPPTHRVIIAASAGNALEWFDFLIYGYFAVTISKYELSWFHPNAFSFLNAL
jgi:MHS family proline/betaine transporter-like MFS transporter